MKNTLLTFILLLSTAGLAAQQVREYTVVVKTSTGRHKGIFEEVLRDSIVLSSGNTWQFIPVSEIRVLKVKEYPRKYRKLITMKPNEPERDIYGRSDDSLGDEIAAEVAAGVSGSVINGIYSLIYNAFNNLAVFRINKNAQTYRYQLYRLNTYSVSYQALPLYEKLKMQKLAEREMDTGKTNNKSK